jgi:NAD(P)H-nitrite reductase large subunit
MRDGQTVAILGNGGAAAECVLALRENGFRGTIRMFADNALPPANPMLTTYFVADKLAYGQLFPFGKDFYRANRVEAVLQSPVVALDATQRMIRNAAGVESPYDKCLIATGASPLMPPVEGMNSARVFAMRTLGDAIKLKAALKQRPRRVVVVGASMVGIKLVELFVHLEVPVCLADLATQIFPQAAHPDCSRVIEERLRALGVALRLGAGIARIEHSGVGVKAHFNDGAPAEEADMVMMCVGVRPNLAFLDGGVKKERGVVVDEFMRTSAEGVYAAGDVAQAPGLPGENSQIFGLWASARLQGKVAGTHMSGGARTIAPEVLHNITHFLGMTFVGVGEVKGSTSELKVERGGHYAQFFWKDRRLVGVNLLDSDEAAGPILNTIVKSAIVGAETEPEEVCQLLEPSGRRFLQYWKSVDSQ